MYCAINTDWFNCHVFIEAGEETLIYPCGCVKVNGKLCKKCNYPLYEEF